MPIYQKPIPNPLTKSSGNEFNDHTSEAAKMKRAREQAYFNSYDFDAIEVIPYDENAEASPDRKTKSKNSSSLNGDFRSSNPINSHQKQQHYLVHHQQSIPFTPNSKNPNSSLLRQQHLGALLSPKSQKRLQNASISSKSLSDSSAPSTASTCSDEYAQHHHHHHHQHQHHQIQHHKPYIQHPSSINMSRYASAMPSTEPKYLQHFKSSFGDSETSFATPSSPSSSDAMSSSATGKILSINGTAAQRRQRSDDITPRELVLDVRNGIDMVDENFLLPRAMIKHHGFGNLNSMPLTEVHSQAPGGNGKFLHSNQSNKLKNTNFMMKMMMMTSSHQGNSSFPNQNINTNITKSSSCSPSATTATSTDINTNTKIFSNTKTKDVLAKGLGKTSLVNEPSLLARSLSNQSIALKQEAATLVLPTCAANATAKPLALQPETVKMTINGRNKKQSTRSATTTTTPTLTATTASTLSHNEITGVAVDQENDVVANDENEGEVATNGDVAAAAADDDDDDGIHVNENISKENLKPNHEDVNIEIDVDVDADVDDEDDDEDLKVLKSKNILRPNLSRSTIASSSLSSSGNVRSQSHQSHYSTDKSGAGSSGYYSSNVCSTYSLDEHIYCEPIIDIVNGVNRNASSKDEKSNHLLSSGVIGKATRPSITSAGLVSPSDQATATASSTAKAKVNLRNELALVKHFQVPQNKMALANVLDATSRTLEMQRSSQNKRKRALTKKTSYKLEKKNGNTSTTTDNSKNVNDDDEEDDENADEDDAEDDEPQKDEPKITLNGNNKDIQMTMDANQDLYNYLDTQEQPYTESLKILEASIENLDRHLKNFHHLNDSDHIVSFLQQNINFPISSDLLVSEKPGVQKILPTIMEGLDDSLKGNTLWKNDIITDDSLMDIDLDSFLLDSEKTISKHTQGIDNPGFIADEQEANHYKCAKYINSCPEDAYHVENDLVSTSSGYVKRYEDQLHFQNTRELLEDVRDKIRLLTQSQNNLKHPSEISSELHLESKQMTEDIPKELDGMIKTLKQELETYLDRMNQHSELEIRQLCSGLTKNHHIVKMKKAFERRKSLQSNETIDYDFSTYEAVRDGLYVTTNAGLPLKSIRHQFTSIRCASDPNFKLKRKSIDEIFPLSGLDAQIDEISPYSQSLTENRRKISLPILSTTAATQMNASQLQRNLSFHKPILSHLDAQSAEPQQADHQAPHQQQQMEPNSSAKMDHDDKDPLASWHRKKPSIWEMYYGTNRLNQSLLGGKKSNNNIVINTNSASLSYPSSRPESDFTLDLPRAEQLRVKMEKEKKFRQRCRFITTFLSLVFFLLTVMVVSLVLTRGKRMFGSMI